MALTMFDSPLCLIPSLDLLRPFWSLSSRSLLEHRSPGAVMVPLRGLGADALLCSLGPALSLDSTHLWNDNIMSPVSEKHLVQLKILKVIIRKLFFFFTVFVTP